MSDESEWKKLSISDEVFIEYATDDDWILFSNMFGDSLEITTDMLDKLIEILQQAKQDLKKEII